MIAVYFLLVSIIIGGGESHFISLTSGADSGAGSGDGGGAGDGDGPGSDSPHDMAISPAESNTVTINNLNNNLTAMSLLPSAISDFPQILAYLPVISNDYSGKREGAW
jgi:hypothetical protein